MKLIFTAQPIIVIRIRAKTGWLGVMKMCPSGAKYLHVYMD
jgi:hypothetical protein